MKNKLQEENWKITFENEFASWWDYKPALTERIEDHIQTLIKTELSTLLKEVEGMKIQKAHTYGSENADVYRAHESGQERMKDQIINLIKSKMV